VWGVGCGVWGVGSDNLPTHHRVQAPDFSRGEPEIFVLRGVARNQLGVRHSQRRFPPGAVAASPDYKKSGFIHGVSPHPTPHTLPPCALRALDEPHPVKGPKAKPGATDDILSWQKAPDVGIVAVIAVISHDEELVLRHPL